MTFPQFFVANWFLFALLFIVLVAIVVYEMRNKDRTQALSNITASAFINDGATLIDLRPAAEYKKGHIAGAKNIPTDKLNDWATSYKHKDRAVVLYCQSGQVARNQIQALINHGFKDVYVLKDGISGWRADNLPLV
ncbi:rhodanese-like domain-containing protein [Suttonella ornithocola]|uniref:Molybdopterin biosynthesis protein MoeB n=1 Tax=Suttonella ornithocola TaxID=279832 RepID=A0A380MM62_9GAMM|nr:rhodanese-like domain-containing protein [Suttonella ornithocola]SUO93715.1 molybdopterin biosynthesis protein MoeB [Suttonella ornithocola]